MLIGEAYNNDKHFWRWMTVILLCGVLLRFYQIAQVEVTEPNVAGYMVITQAMAILADWTWDNAGQVFAGHYDANEVKELFARKGVSYEMPYYSKPFYDVQNFIVYKLSGGHYRSLIWLTAIWGSLTIVNIGLIARSLWGAEAGVWAAGVFALSGSAIAYARDGLAHSASLFLFSLGLLLFLQMLTRQHKGKSALAIGVIWGLALTTHPNTLPLICICLAYAGWRELGRGGLLKGVVHGGTFGVGILAVAGLFELFYIGLHHFLADVFMVMQDQTYWPTMTYFGQIRSHFGLVMTGPFPLLAKVYTYVVVLWAFEGVFVWLAIVMASVACLYRGFSQRREDLLPLALFWVPLLFFILSNNTADFRYIAALLVPAVLLAGRGIEWAVEHGAARTGWGKPLLSLLAASVLLVHVWYLQPLYSTHSAWKETAVWLRDHGCEEVISLSSDFNWVINGIEPKRVQEGLQGRYIALYRRYPQAENERILSMFAKGVSPEFTARHRRPIKMMELQLVSQSPLIEALMYMPLIRSQVMQMRSIVAERDQLRRIEVYDLNKLNSGSSRLEAMEVIGGISNG